MAAKRLSPAAIVALKESLCGVYWYKADLRSFLSNSVSNKALVSSLNWENYKRQIVADLVDTLTGNQDRYLGDLTKLCYEVTSISNFSHLEQLDGGQQKARRAKEAVERLRQLVEPHQEKKKMRKNLNAGEKNEKKSSGQIGQSGRSWQN